MKELLTKTRWSKEEKIKIIKWLITKIPERYYICHIIDCELNGEISLGRRRVYHILTRLGITSDFVERNGGTFTSCPTYIGAITLIEQDEIDRLFRSRRDSEELIRKERVSRKISLLNNLIKEIKES